MTPLLDEVVLSDSSLQANKVTMSSKASKLYLAWLTPDVLLQTGASTILGAAVYLGHSYFAFTISEGVSARPHLVTGIILGMLLVARVVLGITRMYAGVQQVQAFAKSCRSLAVLSVSVTETLTISAAAEVEKKATTRFRYELVRLLNLAFFCYTLMLQGMKLAVPPSSLRATEDTKLEAEILSAVENPAVMVTKMVANLLEQQRSAKRISNELAAVLAEKVCDLIDTYHASLAVALAPSPVALTSFTYFFTTAWAYTAGVTLAMSELGDNTYTAGAGLALTVTYTAFLSLFTFGLYEAGNVVEAPLKAVTELLSTEDLMSSLSDDLASLVDDPTVPVFLPKK